jgi:competence protein ComEC
MRRNISVIVMVVAGMSLAYWSVHRTTHVTSPSTVDFYTGEVSVRGTIADDPDRRVSQTNYIVDAHLLKTADHVVRVEGKLLVSIRAGNPLFAYRDEIEAAGELELPGQIEEFRYDNYLSLKDIYATMNDARMKRLQEASGWSPLRSLYDFRQSLETRMNLLYPEPHASLLAGLLIGSKRGIPDALLTDFKTTGLTHIIAISGYNITMLITVMTTLLFWLPVRWRFVPSVLIIAAFTLLTGASASAVRAAVMGILGLVALQLGRLQTTRLSVLWTAFALGTLPMLALLSFGSASFSQSKHAPLFFKTAGVVVIGLGAFALLAGLTGLGIIEPLFNL